MCQLTIQPIVHGANGESQINPTSLKVCLLGNGKLEIDKYYLTMESKKIELTRVEFIELIKAPNGSLYVLVVMQNAILMSHPKLVNYFRDYNV